MAVEITRRALLGWIGASVVAAHLPRAAAASGSPWMPFIPGLRRTYTLAQMVVTEGDGDTAPLRAPLPGDTAVERILKVWTEGETQVASVEEAYSGGAFTHHQRWRPGGVLADAGPMSSAVGPVVTRSSAGWFLPDALSPGQQWEAETVYESPLSRMHITLAGRAVREEPIETPAGRFQTVEVQVTLRNRVEMLGAASGTPPLESTQEERQHFALGVGLVLVTSRAGNGYSSRKVLTGFDIG